MQTTWGTLLGTLQTGVQAADIIGDSLFWGADLAALGEAAREAGYFSPSDTCDAFDARGLAAAVRGATGDEWRSMQARAIQLHPLVRESRALAGTNGGDAGDGPKKRGPTVLQLPKQFRRFAPIFRGSLDSIEEIALAFQLMETLGGRWKEMADDFDRLHRKRSDSGEAFEIVVDGDGTYCQRGYASADRRTDLADKIVLERGRGTLSAFIHELTHALPLNILFPELSALPYEQPNTEAADFSEDVVANYRLLVQSAYQDESVSVLAEILFYRDLKAAGIPADDLFSDWEVEFLANGLRIYEKEGVQGYLRSEIYIGRNHRLDYNRNGMVQMAMMAALQPKITQNESFRQILAEKGIGLENRGGDLGPVFKAVSEFLSTPTPETARALGAAYLQAGLTFSLDLPKLIAQGKEALALLTGKQQKAPASFAGKKRETETLVGLLSVHRRQFEKSRTDFEAAWKKAGGDAGEVDWRDGAGLLQFWRLLTLLKQGGETESREDLANLEVRVRAVLKENAKRWTYDQLRSISGVSYGRDSYDTWRRNSDSPGNNDIDSDFKETFESLETYVEGVLLLAEAAIERNPNKKWKAWQAVSKNLHLILRLGPDNSDPLFGLLIETLENPFTGLPGITPQDLDFAVERYDNKPYYFRLYDSNYPIFGGAIRDLLYKHLIDRNHLFRFFTHLTLSGGTDTTRYITGLADLGGEGEIEEEEQPGIVPLFYWQAALLQFVTRVNGPFLENPELLSERELQFNDGDYVSGEEAPLTAPGLGNHIPTALEIQSTLMHTGGGLPQEIPSKEEETATHADIYYFLPLLFPCPSHSEETPSGLRMFPPAPVPGKAVSLIAYQANPTVELLTLLRRAQGAGNPLEEIDIHTIVSIPAVWNLLVPIDTMDHDPFFLEIESSAENIWLQASYLLELLPLLAAQGHTAQGRQLLENIHAGLEPCTAAASETLRTVARFVAAAAEAAETFLPLHAIPDNEQEAVLDEIRGTFETALRLRRRFHPPHLILRSLRPFVRKRELRDAVGRWMPGVIEQIAALDLHTDDFQRGILSFIRFIDEAPILYEEKDRWLTLLFETVLPKRESGLSLRRDGVTKQIRFLEWMEQTLLTGEQLEKIGYYAKVKERVLKSLSGLLEELQAVRLPGAMQNRLIGAVIRLEELLHRLHPELTDPSSGESLANLSRDPSYQEALSDCFPSRRVWTDDSLPVARWAPAAVRRGLPDPDKGWKRLKQSLERAQVLGPRGTLYEAFVLERIERSGKLALSVEEALDLFRRYEERKAGGEEDAEIRGALTLYTTARRIFSLKDRLLLESLTDIPAVAWGLQKIEAGIARGELNEKEETVLKALLAAPTISDAYRKRELFLAVLADEALPLPARRQAARGLVAGTATQNVLESLIEGYAAEENPHKEANLYRLITEYWKRIGSLPDADNLMLMDEEGQKGNSIFWDIFDDVLSRVDRRRFENDTEILVRVLSRGKFGERYLGELRQYLSAADPKRLNLVFGEEFDRLIGAEIGNRRSILPLLEGVEARLREHRERLDILRMKPPAAFLRQPREIRFLLLSFLKHLPGGQTESLIAELKEMGEEGSSDAEIFLRFFARTGLEKAGQFLSTMVGVIPNGVRKVFEELQDRVSESSFHEVRQTVEREIQAKMEDLFTYFDPTPVASASMGEVYRAVLKDGREVVVKVAPLSKRVKTEETIRTLKKVASDVEALNGHLSGRFDVGGMLRRFIKQLERQTDFSKEAMNAERTEGVDTPVYLREYSGPALLVMLPAKGIKPTKAANAAERSRIADVYAVGALRMLFVEGTYHADPHPGNQIWNPETGKLTWIDWGILGHLSTEERDRLIPFLGAAMAGGADEQVEALKTIAEGEKGEGNFDRLRERLGRLPAGGSSGERVGAVLAATGAEQIYLEPNSMQAVAYLLTVTGTAADLDPDFDIGQALLKLYSQGLEESLERAIAKDAPIPLSPEDERMWESLLTEAEMLRAIVERELPTAVDSETRTKLDEKLVMIRGAKNRGEVLQDNRDALASVLADIIKLHPSFEIDKYLVFGLLAECLEEALSGDPNTVAEILHELNNALPPHRRWQGEPILEMETAEVLADVLDFFDEREVILRLHLTEKILRDNLELFE